MDRTFQGFTNAISEPTRDAERAQEKLINLILLSTSICRLFYRKIPKMKKIKALYQQTSDFPIFRHASQLGIVVMVLLRNRNRQKFLSENISTAVSDKIRFSGQP